MHKGPASLRPRCDTAIPVKSSQVPVDTYKIIYKILWQWQLPLLFVVFLLLFFLLGDFYSAAENCVCIVIIVDIHNRNVMEQLCCAGKSLS